MGGLTISEAPDMSDEAPVLNFMEAQDDERQRRGPSQGVLSPFRVSRVWWACLNAMFVVALASEKVRVEPFFKQLRPLSRRSIHRRLWKDVNGGRRERERRLKKLVRSRDRQQKQGI